MSGAFLSDGIDNIKDQMARKSEENQKMKKEGFIKVRALDTMTNKMINTWIKKDEATIKYEKEEEERAKLDEKSKTLSNRAAMLEILKKNKEIEAREKELDALEAEILADKPTKAK